VYDKQTAAKKSGQIITVLPNKKLLSRSYFSSHWTLQSTSTIVWSNLGPRIIWL